MWKNLYLFFCFLESANNVREPNNKSSQRQKARVLIEIENNNHFATRKTYKSKMFFPALCEPHFPFSLGASSLKIFKIIATYY